MTAKNLARLDYLLNDLTAFRTLAEMRAATAAGYVPTVTTQSKRRGELVRGLRAAGVRVFTGRRTR